MLLLIYDTYDFFIFFSLNILVYKVLFFYNSISLREFRYCSDDSSEDMDHPLRDMALNLCNVLQSPGPS